MADPLLTSLCAICHASTPRYKCPRCQLQTCSAACVKKHKAWSECSGERDATAFVPRSQLRTVKGVNHDYNFLHKMDLSLERAERVLVGDKGLVRPEELRPQTAQPVRWKTGRDGKTRPVPAAAPRAAKEGGARRLDRHLAQRLRQLNIEVLQAPQGMSRQVENKTSFNRRTGCIAWQVEWLIYGDDDQSPAAERRTEPGTRRLSKVAEDVPLYQAYQAVCEDKGRPGRSRGPRSGRRDEAQRPSDSTWKSADDLAQDPLTGLWVCYQGPDVGERWPGEAEEMERRRFRYFLRGAPASSNLATTIAALEPTDCLRDILANSRLFEFPTLYVLKAGAALPAGLAVGPKHTVSAASGRKRIGGPGAETGLAKRRKLDPGEAGLEDGEVDGSGEGPDGLEGAGVEGPVSQEDEDSPTSSSGADEESDSD